MEFAAWAESLSRWGRARGRNVLLLGSVESTNQTGLDLLDRSDGVVPEAWILALHQRGGRGRFGRDWVSPPGAGVYASWVRSLPSRALVGLPLAVGVAICRALARIGFECRLKWPNDVLLDGAKVGGILLHGRVRSERAAVVVGFGVNRDHRREELPRVDCTSLRRSARGRLPDLATLSAFLADEVERECARYRGDGSWAGEALARRYAACSAHAPGDRMVISSDGGMHRGQLIGFTPEGQLRLATESGERRFTAGDLSAEAR